MTLTTYILILVTGLSPGSSMATAEYDDLAACQTAIEIAAKPYADRGFSGTAGSIKSFSSCTPKSSTPAVPETSVAACALPKE